VAVPRPEREVRPSLLDRKGERLPMSALSGVGISGTDGPPGSEVEGVDDPHDESSWAPMTRCDPPQDGSGVLIDHHTGLKLVTQPRKEPPRALRHPRLVAATTHNYEHSNHHRSQERANPSKRHTYSRCPHGVTLPDFCSDKATSWSSSSEVKHSSGRSQPSAAARLHWGQGAPRKESYCWRRTVGRRPSWM